MFRAPTILQARASILGIMPMREYNKYAAHVAECEQQAKDARNETERQSWLVMADSWRETAKLQEALKRQAEFIRKTPQRASVSHDH